MTFINQCLTIRMLKKTTDYLLIRVVNIIVKECTLTKEKGAIYDGQYEIMIYSYKGIYECLVFFFLIVYIFVLKFQYFNKHMFKNKTNLVKLK
jgi:uncharacterized membrane protein